MGLWIIGILLFVACILTGVNIPGSEILKEHVLFNHTNFMIFIVGVMVSVYLDTLIVSKLDPTADPPVRTIEGREGKGNR